MERYDLIIVGTGSGNMIPPALDGWKIAIVERDAFGGTCVNRGCIPSKMLVYAADVAAHVRDSARYGVHATLDRVDWPAVRDRVFGRIDRIAVDGERYRVEDCPDVDVYKGTGRFVDHKVLEVDGARITAERFVLGVGARPFVPKIPGLADSGFHTSDTIMRVDSLPERLVVLGGGYIAAELGHVFGAFGSEVAVINRGPRLLRFEDDDISARYTELAGDRFDLTLGARARRVEREGDEVRVVVEVDGDERVVTGDALLVATGRIPNSDLLDVERTGVGCDPAGRVLVHADLMTDVDGIYAFGDLVNHHQLKHVANAEARVVFHNVAHPDDRREMDYSIVPHAIFGDPQVASVGLTERDAAADNLPFDVAVTDYGSTAYGWAMEDTTSFVKLVAHSETRRLLGAHIVGPQASILVQLLIQGMRFGRTVDELSTEQMWIHPALTEVVENALLEF